MQRLVLNHFSCKTWTVLWRTSVTYMSSVPVRIFSSLVPVHLAALQRKAVVLAFSLCMENAPKWPAVLSALLY